MAAGIVANNVDALSDAYQRMARRWDLISDLNGGTRAMREARTKWLPQEDKESPTAYDNRLKRSILFNAYRDTTRKIVARPFSKPVTIEGDDDLAPQLAEIADDADMEGTDLTQLAKELMRDGLDHGLTHVLVDFPKVPGKATLADERTSGVRPLFLPISPTQIIGWRAMRADNGHMKLTQIRVKEIITENVGSYGTRDIEQVRVWTETAWEIHRKDPDTDKYSMTDQGEHTFGSIPLFTAYFDKTGFMTGKPTLEDLGWLNLAHWQSSSDQRHILRFARCGLLFLSGVNDDEVKDKPVVLGANQMWTTPNENADMKIVEHSGKAIGAGKDDLNDLEERMQLMGLQPFVQKSGTETATGKAIDEAHNMTDIEAWIRSLERLLEHAFTAAARWIKKDLPADFRVDIFSEFGLGLRGATDVDALIRTRLAGDIDRETLLKELRRRGVIDESEAVADIIARLETEGPDLSAIDLQPAPGDGGGDDGDDGSEGATP